MNELVCVGKVINFFGIKGELKILSDFNKKDIAFTCGMHVMIKEEILEITSVRYHKNYILIRINNINDINLITKYIGYNVYVKKSDLQLEENEYLLEDLVGSTVKDGDEDIGKVIAVLLGNGTNYVRVLKNQKEYLIPLINIYIQRFDKKAKILYTNNAKSLII